MPTCLTLETDVPSVWSSRFSCHSTINLLYRYSLCKYDARRVSLSAWKCRLFFFFTRPPIQKCCPHLCLIFSISSSHPTVLYENQVLIFQFALVIFSSCVFVCVLRLPHDNIIDEIWWKLDSFFSLSLSTATWRHRNGKFTEGRSSSWITA